jgi:hypothetical protein
VHDQVPAESLPRRPLVIAFAESTGDGIDRQTVAAAEAAIAGPSEAASICAEYDRSDRDPLPVGQLIVGEHGLHHANLF